MVVLKTTLPDIKRRWNRDDQPFPSISNTSNSRSASAIRLANDLIWLFFVPLQSSHLYLSESSGETRSLQTISRCISSHVPSALSHYTLLVSLPPSKSSEGNKWHDVTYLMRLTDSADIHVLFIQILVVPFFQCPAARPLYPD